VCPVEDPWVLAVIATPTGDHDPLFLDLGYLLPSLRRGSRWSARSAATTNDLEARRATVRMEAEEATSGRTQRGLAGHGGAATLLARSDSGNMSWRRRPRNEK
jgi:hypothetical protein